MLFHHLLMCKIVGYLRIILALVSFYYMRTDPWLTSAAYLLSQLLDAVDGHAASFFNQSTKFGAMLDQLTDRGSTMCLMFVLAYFYPQYMFVFQCAATLDIVSHWLHIHTTLLSGSTNHKAIDLEGARRCVDTPKLACSSARAWANQKPRRR